MIFCFLHKSPAEEKALEAKQKPWRDKEICLNKTIIVTVRKIEKELDEINSKCSLTDSNARSTEIKNLFISKRQLLDTYIQKNDTQIEELCDLKQHLTEHCSDITTIELCWKEFKDHFRSILPERTPTPMAAVDRPLIDSNRYCILICHQIEEVLHRIKCKANKHSIPSTVNDWLDRKPTGDILNFNKMFEHEIPSQQDRADLLDFMAMQALEIHGFVDVERGLIYAAPKRDWDRRLRIAEIALVLIGGFFFAYALSQLGVWGVPYWGIASNRQIELIFTYALLLVGVFIHFYADRWKARKIQSAGSNSTDLTTAGGPTESEGRRRFWLWVSIRRNSIIWGIVPLYFGLAYLAFFAQPINWFLAVALGYSIDSVVDLVLNRFTQQVAA